MTAHLSPMGRHFLEEELRNCPICKTNAMKHSRHAHSRTESQQPPLEGKMPQSRIAMQNVRDELQNAYRMLAVIEETNTEMSVQLVRESTRADEAEEKMMQQEVLLAEMRKEIEKIHEAWHVEAAARLEKAQATLRKEYESKIADLTIRMDAVARQKSGRGARERYDDEDKKNAQVARIAFLEKQLQVALDDSEQRTKQLQQTQARFVRISKYLEIERQRNMNVHANMSARSNISAPVDGREGDKGDAVGSPMALSDIRSQSLQPSVLQSSPSSRSDPGALLTALQQKESECNALQERLRSMEVASNSAKEDAENAWMQLSEERQRTANLLRQVAAKERSQIDELGNESLVTSKALLRMKETYANASPTVEHVAAPSEIADSLPDIAEIKRLHEKIEAAEKECRRLRGLAEQQKAATEAQQLESQNRLRIAFSERDEALLQVESERSRGDELEHVLHEMMQKNTQMMIETTAMEQSSKFRLHDIMKKEREQSKSFARDAETAKFAISKLEHELRSVTDQLEEASSKMADLENFQREALTLAASLRSAQEELSRQKLHSKDLENRNKELLEKSKTQYASLRSFSANAIEKVKQSYGLQIEELESELARLSETSSQDANAASSLLQESEKSCKGRKKPSMNSRRKSALRKHEMWS